MIDADRACRAGYIAGLLEAAEYAENYQDTDYWAPSYSYDGISIGNELRGRAATQLEAEAKAHPDAVTYVVIVGLVEGRRTRYMITIAGPGSTGAGATPTGFTSSLEDIRKAARKTQMDLLRMGHFAIISDGPDVRLEEEARRRCRRREGRRP